MMVNPGMVGYLKP